MKLNLLKYFLIMFNIIVVLSACGVHEENNNPTITTTPITTVVAGYNYTYDVDATDPENQHLIYTLSKSPNGMEINKNTGVITWTNIFDTGTYEIIIEVTDPRNGIAVQKFNLIVTNSVPVITTIPDTNTYADTYYYYDVNATDSDYHTLTYSLETYPSGMTISSTSGFISWKTASETGSYYVKIKVTDSGTAFTYQEFYIYNANRKPVITSSPDSALIINDKIYTYTVQATDPDNQIITYQLDTFPYLMSITPVDGIINWNILADSGQYDVTVRATDEGGQYCTQSFTIIIINDPPLITSEPVISAAINDIYQYDVNAVDSEGYTIYYNLIHPPQNMSIDTNSGLITWYTPNDTGIYDISVKAIDSGAAFCTQSFQIELSLTNVEFYNVPAGSFYMGSPDTEGYENEHPQHLVYISQFEISKYEITNEQYRRFLENYGQDTIMSGQYQGETMIYTSIYSWALRKSGNTWIVDDAYKRTPVVNVTWYGAYEFARYFNWRLPTEAEWEYAARGPNGYTYPWGNFAPNTKIANYDYNVSKPVNVGFYPDGRSWCLAWEMAGNVREWVNDWYGLYSSGPDTNPTGPNSGTLKIYRGGAWGKNTLGGVRSAARNHSEPYQYGRYTGFRVAR